MRVLRLLSALRSHVYTLERRKRMKRVKRRMRVVVKMSATNVHAAAGASRNSDRANHACDEEAKQSPVTFDGEIESSDSGGEDTTMLAPTLLNDAAVRLYGGKDSPLYMRRKRQLLAVFEILDLNHEGEVKVEQQIQAMMELLGHKEHSGEMAKLVIAELDSNGDGNISFQELFDWIAAHEAMSSSPVRAVWSRRCGRPGVLSRAVQTPHAAPRALVLRQEAAREITADLFRFIDTNQDNVVTLAEMYSALKALGGSTLTEDDVLAIVQEADVDCSGVIDMPEFQALCARHLFDTQGLDM